MQEEKVLEVKNLKTYFYTDEGVIPAVDGVDFNLARGETLAIVGESGCGKSVTSLSILRLIANPPGRIIDGEILYNGKNLLSLTEKEMRSVRGNDISMIFQEPMTSLNPVFPVGKQIMESLTFHQHMTKEQARERAIEMLRLVEIPNPEKCIHNYPHQLSGGMRQRVMIAIALACDPDLLIADEPTTALDVTIQAQILDLMKDIKRSRDTSIIMITHDLGIVYDFCDKVAVFYTGEVVEYAPVKALFDHPLHPYTEGLIQAIPRLGHPTRRLDAIEGMVPDAGDMPQGCHFHPRCKYATERCRQEHPALVERPDGRCVRCFRAEEEA